MGEAKRRRQLDPNFGIVSRQTQKRNITVEDFRSLFSDFETILRGIVDKLIETKQLSASHEYIVIRDVLLLVASSKHILLATLAGHSESELEKMFHTPFAAGAYHPVALEIAGVLFSSLEESDYEEIFSGCV